MSLRIGFDGGLFPASDRGGLARYRCELLAALLEASDQHEFFVYGRDPGGWIGADVRVHSREAAAAAPGGGIGAYRQWWLPRAARRDRIDVMHYPLGSSALLGGPPAVVSVHDMLCLRSGELDYPVPVRGFRFRVRKRYHRVLIPATLRRAHRVLASSDSTRRDVVTRVGVPPERVRVVPLAISRTFQGTPAPELEARVRARLDLPAGYVLAFSSIDPRKNTHRVIEAHGQLPGELARRHPLVVVLTQDTHRASLESAARRGRTEARFLPYLDDADLPCVYRGAAMLAYPSLFEGFGLPVLEAMSLGIPVLASAVGGIPEVAGDAAHWVDPRSPEAIRVGMETLLADRGLREGCVLRGRARARTFSWDRTARATLEVLEEVGR